MKKALMVATVPSMIGQFNMDNIRLLKELGYEVYVACNFKDRSVWSKERVKSFVHELKEEEVKYHQIDFCRNPLDIKKDINAYKELNRLVDKEKIMLIHCHTPVAGVISRIVAHKSHIKVIYTVHGFHFFKGAPIKNWMIFYPIEKFFSRWTDVLITINKEDYERTKKNFHAKKTVYVPGVGIDLEKFQYGMIDADAKRKELGIKEDEIFLLSVGELTDRKNHDIVIRAITKMKNKKIKYFICGQGYLKDDLLELITQLGMEDQVTLLGYRSDISELCQAADLFVFPSLQEGLPVALMEAIACKTPVICTNIRGNTDLVKNEEDMFKADKADMLAECIRQKLGNGSRMNIRKCMNTSIKRNYRRIQELSLPEVSKKMEEIYVDI